MLLTVSCLTYSCMLLTVLSCLTYSCLLLTVLYPVWLTRVCCWLCRPVWLNRVCCWLFCVLSDLPVFAVDCVVSCLIYSCLLLTVLSRLTYSCMLLTVWWSELWSCCCFLLVTWSPPPQSHQKKKRNKTKQHRIKELKPMMLLKFIPGLMNRFIRFSNDFPPVFFALDYIYMYRTIKYDYNVIHRINANKQDTH